MLLTERTSEGYAGSLPDTVTVYRRPLVADFGDDPGRLEDEIRMTVVHELGHHFGLDEDELERLGWGGPEFQPARSLQWSIVTAFRILRFGDEELPPVACLHDVRGHARRFERMARMLEPGRHVIAYDLRGHGRSPWSGPHTMQQHLDDLDEVLDACDVDQAGLIGDGFGARIAIAYASRKQERINSLTLLDPPLWPAQDLLDAAIRSERRGGGYAGVDAGDRGSVAGSQESAGKKHTPRGLLEEDMAEHLVADEDGQFSLPLQPRRRPRRREADGLSPEGGLK